MFMHKPHPNSASVCSRAVDLCCAYGSHAEKESLIDCLVQVVVYRRTVIKLGNEISVLYKADSAIETEREAVLRISAFEPSAPCLQSALPRSRRRIKLHNHDTPVKSLNNRASRWNGHPTVVQINDRSHELFEMKLYEGITVLFRNNELFPKNCYKMRHAYI
jgi:hypothetical protein